VQKILSLKSETMIFARALSLQQKPYTNPNIELSFDINIGYQVQYHPYVYQYQIQHIVQAYLQLFIQFKN